LAIEKEKAYFKWCDEHPDELEKRCLEHYPKLEIVNYHGHPLPFFVAPAE